MASTINELLGGTASNGGSSSTSGGSSNSQTGNGGDRGVVDYGSNGRPATQQPTSDPSENARRMVEQKRQETAPVQPAPSSDTGKQGFGDYLNDDGEIDTDKLRGLAVNERMKVIDQWLRRNPEETPEDAARKQRRERWRNVYSALGDGIASLANLYYTTRYAPNAYDPTQGLTARAKERYDRLQKERENTIEERLKMYDRLGTMADDLDAMEIKKQAAKANADYKASEAKRKADLAAAQQEVLKARAAKDSAATAFAEKKLEYMVNYGWPAEQAEKQAKIDLDKARTKAADASAGASSASAAYSRAKGAAVNPYKVYNKETKRYEYFPTKDSAITAAQQYGTAVEVVAGSKTSTSTAPVKNSRGKVTGKATTTSTTTSKSVVPASRETVEGRGKHSGFSIHKK